MTSKLTVNEVLTSVDAVLFDFDGPLCDVFAGLPAWQIAAQLQDLIGTHHDTDDPLEVLRLTKDASAEKLLKLEDALITSELAAVRTSKPEEQGLESIRKLISKGRRTGIVSNNAPQAIASFLRNFGLSGDVNPIIGRAYGRPDLMKPNPWPIEQALRELRTTSSHVAFIGDSLTDIEVAQVTGTYCIAYANKPDKRASFARTNAIIVDSMHEVLEAI